MMMLNKVKLANGSEVTWEEFSKWSNNKQRMSLTPSFKGKTHSEESRKQGGAKVSQANKGRIVSDETRAKISESTKGRKVLEESLVKRRATWLTKDRSLTEEHKNKLRGRKLTEEQKSKRRGRKISEEHMAILRKPKSEEFKANLRGRKISEEALAKRKATRSVTLMWHTPNGTFPNKMAIYLKVRSDLKIPHLKAIELVESWIRDFPHLYYRNTKN
jgi:hypothetical protein